MQWDDTTSKLIKETADKFGVPTDQAKLLIETYEQCNLREMRQFNCVVWANLGKLYIDQNKTIKYLRRRFDKYKKGEISKEKLIEDIDFIYPLHEAARWHKPRVGRRYKFQLKIKELEAQGIKWKKASWGPEQIKYRRELYKKCVESIPESCLQQTPTTSSEAI